VALGAIMVPRKEHGEPLFSQSFAALPLTSPDKPHGFGNPVMDSPHKSDSSEQKAAEAAMLRALESKLGITFDDKAKLQIDAGVQPDAIHNDSKTVVEVYARIGAVRGAQLHKIKGDILKLAFIGVRLGDQWRRILCFASKEAASYVSGTSWVAQAARKFGVEVVVVDIPAETRESVLKAQTRQRMVNPD